MTVEISWAPGAGKNTIELKQCFKLRFFVFGLRLFALLSRPSQREN